MYQTLCRYTDRSGQEVREVFNTATEDYMVAIETAVTAFWAALTPDERLEARSSFCVEARPEGFPITASNKERRLDNPQAPF
jgi:hypothetical protein